MRRRNWLRRGKVRNSKGSSPPAGRSLRMEQLDPRKMLSITVNTLVDEADGTLDGEISLRDAIAAASIFGGETIDFSVTGTINLNPSLGSLLIDRSLTINGPGASLLTIDAGQQFRAIDIAAFTYYGAVELNGVTITGGRTIGDNTGSGDFTHSGGGIRSLSTGRLTIRDSVIENNSTTGSGAWGGGLFSLGRLELRHSTVSGNSTAGEASKGGGIAADGPLAIYLSVIKNNSTAGRGAEGGAIYARDYNFALQTTITGNSTAGDFAKGGGVFGAAEVSLIESTIWDNHTTGANSGGGGAYSQAGLALKSSTVSGNSTMASSSPGGGVFAGTPGAEVSYSTVTANHAGGVGGGLYFGSGTIQNSIVAGNTSGTSSPDLGTLFGTVNVSFSLIGDNAGTALVEAQTPDFFGNLIGSAAGAGIINLLLGPLQNNGGPTFTHALPDDSPARDAGDPGAQPQELVTGVPLFDQRGDNFGRVQNNRIDMGAFEIRDTASADFDGDGFVSGLDFLIWQTKIFPPITPPNAVKADGDADNDRDVDASDLAIWELQYGGPAPSAAPLIIESPVQHAAVGVAPGVPLTPIDISRGDLFDAALALARLTYTGRVETDPIIAENVVAAAYAEAYSSNDSPTLPAVDPYRLSDFASSRAPSDEAEYSSPDDELAGLGEADLDD